MSIRRSMRRSIRRSMRRIKRTLYRISMRSIMRMSMRMSTMRRTRGEFGFQKVNKSTNYGPFLSLPDFLLLHQRQGASYFHCTLEHCILHIVVFTKY